MSEHAYTKNEVDACYISVESRDRRQEKPRLECQLRQVCRPLSLNECILGGVRQVHRVKIMLILPWLMADDVHFIRQPATYETPQQYLDHRT